MSKKKTKNNKSNKMVATNAAKTARPDGVGTKALNILPAAPGLLMCLLTLFMLLVDIFSSNADTQYELYPAAFNAVNIIIVLAGIAFLGAGIIEKEGRTALKSRLKDDKVSWICFAAFLLCILISTCINGLTDLAVSGVPYRFIGIFDMAAFILIYMLVSSFTGTGTGTGTSVNSRNASSLPKDSGKGKGLAGSAILNDRAGGLVLICYSIVADLIAVSALFDRYIGEIPAYHAKKELSAIFFNGNHYGYFLMMAVLIGIGLYLFAEGRIMYLGVATAALNAVVLALNHSLGSILAVLIVIAAASAFILIKDKEHSKRLELCIGALVIVAIGSIALIPNIGKEFSGLFADIGNILSGNATGSEGHNRLALWSLTWDYIREKPLFGHGCEGIAISMYEATRRSNPHSELLTYAAYYGIPAAIAYFAGVVSIFIRAIRRYGNLQPAQKAACMAAAGYFISSFTGVAMFYLTPFFFIFLGYTGGKGHVQRVS